MKGFNPPKIQTNLPAGKEKTLDQGMKE